MFMLLIHLASVSAAFHGALCSHATARCHRATARNGPLVACASSNDLNRLITEASTDSVSSAVSILNHRDSKFKPSETQAAALLDVACALSSVGLSSSEQNPTKQENDYQRKQQEDLTAVYEALSNAGALRGFGSVSAAALLPLGIERKEVSTDDQLLLTGLPTTAFAPPRGGSPSDIFLGAGSAALLATGAAALDLDVRVVIGVVGVALLADTVAFRGAIAESATRAFKPGYGTTVREHEAGHFLVAYLLGCPIEACLLDVWKAATDGRFSGAAGTVFFDPQLGSAMNGGTITREIIDRYSVVVMAGIAAEAAQNQRAEGGQADESALIQLLGSLDGGRSWDINRIQNQARWASSQALLLLREHGGAYLALCAALERGESVGECVMAIENGLTESFGRSGELPAETRRRELEESRAAANVVLAAASSEASAAGSLSAVQVAEVVDERQAQIAKRLEEIREQLRRENDTWEG